MYSQIVPANSYVSPLQTVWSLAILIHRWLYKLASQLRGTCGQSRWVRATILFTDIAGFSAILAHLPRHQQQQILESLTGEYYDLLRRSVRDCGGNVDKFIGDGMMAIFSNPGDAVNAAQQIQWGITRFNVEQERRRHPSFPTRTAIASGWVIRKSFGPFWRRNRTYLGAAVNTAAHLAEVGYPGQVLISHPTFEQVSVEATSKGWRRIEKVGGGIAYELREGSKEGIK
jgi:class 3 adenylate cyclase